MEALFFFLNIDNLPGFLVSCQRCKRVSCNSFANLMLSFCYRCHCCRCNADPLLLADYLFASVSREKPLAELQTSLLEELDVFLHNGMFTFIMILWEIFRYICKLQKVTVGVVMSVCTSVRPHGTTWLQIYTFSWNVIFEYSSKTWWLKSDRNNGHFTWRSIYIYDNIWPISF